MAGRAGEPLPQQDARGRRQRPDACSGAGTHRLRGRLLHYRLRDDDLVIGTSLGNGHGWITTKGQGTIDGFFSADLCCTMMGAILVRFSGLGNRAVLRGGHETAPGRDAFIQIRPEEPSEAVLRPAYQRFVFELAGGGRVRPTIFVPRRPRHWPTAVGHGGFQQEQVAPLLGGFVGYMFFQMQTNRLFRGLLGEMQSGTLEQRYLSPLPS